MKKNILFTAALFAVLGMATAQQNQNAIASGYGVPTWFQYNSKARLSVSTYVERTHIGPKAGTSVGVEFKNRMGLGVFYQESNVFLSEIGSDQPTDLPSYYEKQFYGVYFNVPIEHHGIIGFDFNIRTGVTNNENFTITPSVLSTLKLAKFVELGAGVGMRAFRPTVQTSVNIKF